MTELHVVLCPSFHGATLLALMLNNHSEISCLGDTLPRRELDQPCACGERVSACAHWREIARRIDADRFRGHPWLLPDYPVLFDNRPLRALYYAAMAAADCRTWQLPSASLNRLFNRTAGGMARAAIPLAWRMSRGALDAYARVYLDFYEAIREMHGTRLCVDGSKRLGRVVALRSALGTDAKVKLIHLLRDPRGFAASWRRNVGAQSAAVLGGFWLDMHRRIEDYARAEPAIAYHAIRYEDLCTAPGETMAGLFDFLGVANEEVGGAPRFPGKHHLMGNVMLFRFDGSISLDTRWRSELPDAEQAELLHRTRPLSERLGYV